MSIILEILKELNNTNLYYKGVRVNMFGIPQFKSFKKNSIKSSLTQMKNNGLVERIDQNWVITKSGKQYLNKKNEGLRQFKFSTTKNNLKNLIVIFDVPEKEKYKRDWLRFHLKKLGFEIIQKSVWVGPSPLPKDFLEYIKEIQLKDSIKSFKLSKPYK